MFYEILQGFAVLIVIIAFATVLSYFVKKNI